MLEKVDNVINVLMLRKAQVLVTHRVGQLTTSQCYDIGPRTFN